MSSRKIREGIFSVGVVDWDRTMFDALIPLPNGTSYNSYIVIGANKTALIDTVDSSKTEEFLCNLASYDKIDYLVSNHAEQDHSGSIQNVLELHPEKVIVTNSKCKELLQDMYEIPDEKFKIISDNDTLDLGGRTLKFIFAPWVHWPETMLTYLVEDKILFTCDMFGSHVATSDLYVENEGEVYVGAKRYYAEIMMPFARHIRKHLVKVNELDLELIAPSHGPIYGNPRLIIDAYSDWSSGNVKNEAFVGYVSMHGTTKKMANYLTGLLVESGIKVRQFNLETSDLGEVAMALVDVATIVLCSPTVLVGAHPHVAYTALICNELRPKAKFITLIGSYGWGGKMPEQIKSLTSSLPAEFIEPVIIKGHSTVDSFAPLKTLAEKIVSKHNEIGFNNL